MSNLAICLVLVVLMAVATAALFCYRWIHEQRGITTLTATGCGGLLHPGDKLVLNGESMTVLKVVDSNTLQVGKRWWHRLF